MRIALALLVVAACSKSSAPPERDRNGTGGSPTPVAGGPGSGPANTPPMQPASPGQETQVARPSAAVMEQQIKIARAGSGTPPSDLPADLGANGGKGPPGKITIESKTSFDHTDLTADAVADTIVREHLAALGACYRGTLARDAKVAGKATLALTVKPDGALGKAVATAPDAALQSCFTKAMATWTFPVPKNADGEPAEAGFQIALALLPQ